MNKKIVVVAVLALSSWSSLAFGERIAFINVNVVPMTSETLIEAQTVIVDNGLIANIGDVDDIPISDDLLIVDGTDRFLMPGLAEMHGHVPSAGSRTVNQVLELYVVNGITLTRGMLGGPSHLRLRQQILDHEVLGPTLYTSGPSLNGRSITSPDQAAELVRKQFAAGYDFLKIHPGLTRREFAIVAETANELGMPFAGHVPADVGVFDAVAAGIATIDHLDGYMQTLMSPNIDPSGGFDSFFGILLAPHADRAKIIDVVDATRLAGTWNVPTQSLFEHRVSSVSAEEMSQWPEVRYMPAATVRRWKQAKLDMVNDRNFNRELADTAVSIRRQIIKTLHERGAGLLLGSDAPQVFNVPGFAIHRELEFLVESGLTPFQALQTGTVNPAEFLKRSDRSGRIKIGYVADLVLLDENPLQNISATRRVHGVALRGKWISQPDIRKMLKRLQR